MSGKIGNTHDQLNDTALVRNILIVEITSKLNFTLYESEGYNSGIKRVRHIKSVFISHSFLKNLSSA